MWIGSGISTVALMGGLCSPTPKMSPRLRWCLWTRHGASKQARGAGASIKGGADPAGGGTWGASATSPGALGVAVVDSQGEATAADGPRATVPVGKDTGVDAGLSAGSVTTHGGSEAAITAAARRAFSGAGTVGGAETRRVMAGCPRQVAAPSSTTALTMPIVFPSAAIPAAPAAE